ncbi:agamous-like MADS-box protein AGL61 [Panicum virgatum]|uniref:MADS-box domain-containing protein n=1 Tax=Panicum virgatum TaxID=38727 RepID=A0A8T0T9N9_PANVG|nr:agamous-like MADS-box protein AGL61 [Panicum virgatum]XP_039807170.1 agamous-like MADS-box protein AGL61 [Panicum virgatum]KAG2606328.1 hypothetical protein PVAP13_4NG227400 [Panicum virgatum]
MAKELRPIDNEHQRRESFWNHRATLFGMANELYEEFGAHVAVIAFSPAGEPHAFGAPTVDSVLRTYFPAADGPPPNPTTHAPSPGAAAGVGAETAGEAAARVAGMRREVDETKVLVTEEWARVAAATEKVRAAQGAAQKQNWGEVDVEVLGEEELPVFMRALEMLKAEVQERIDAMASAQMSLPRERKQQ